MQMSEKKRSELYGVIHEQLMQLRIELRRTHQLPSDADHKIAQSIHPIWRDVKKTLNIEEQ